jgi:hypothetical protein
VKSTVASQPIRTIGQADVSARQPPYPPRSHHISHEDRPPHALSAAHPFSPASARSTYRPGSHHIGHDSTVSATTTLDRCSHHHGSRHALTAAHPFRPGRLNDYRLCYCLDAHDPSVWSFVIYNRDAHIIQLMIKTGAISEAIIILVITLSEYHAHSKKRGRSNRGNNHFSEYQ